MANKEHITILNQGVRDWNQWREDNPTITPNLTWANLKAMNLQGKNLSRANLCEADLGNMNLSGANLVEANLSEAKLVGTNLTNANLSHANLAIASLNKANLRGAKLIGAKLIRAILMDADLTGSDLRTASLIGADLSRAYFNAANLSKAEFSKATLVGANLSSADLSGVNFSGAEFGWTKLSDNDLSVVKGLVSASHIGPSSIGIDTLYKSGGKIPEVFLRDCGVPESFISYLPSLLASTQPLQFYSCFISYSHNDEEFAKRLHSRMRDERLRVWFAPEDIKGGEKLYEQIEKAIRYHDKLLVVLSEHSLQSEWVITEIRDARKDEVERRRRKLFPIRLVDMEALKRWKCFDADVGKDLAIELREYFIPDFSNWKDHDSFEAAFKKLLKDFSTAEISERLEP